jgi:shikimate kinase
MVWLQASAQVLLERIGEDSGRPLLVNGRTWPEDVELTLDERQPLYRAAADYAVDTENSSPEVVAETIIKLLTARGDMND